MSPNWHVPLRLDQSALQSGEMKMQYGLQCLVLVVALGVRYERGDDFDRCKLIQLNGEGLVAFDQSLANQGQDGNGNGNGRVVNMSIFSSYSTQYIANRRPYLQLVSAANMHALGKQGGQKPEIACLEDLTAGHCLSTPSGGALSS